MNRNKETENKLRTYKAMLFTLGFLAKLHNFGLDHLLVVDVGAR